MLLQLEYKLDPAIVKFSRRMAKIGVLKNKKNQSDVRIFKDITKARLNFLRMIKTDVKERVQFFMNGGKMA